MNRFDFILTYSKKEYFYSNVKTHLKKVRAYAETEKEARAKLMAQYNCKNEQLKLIKR